MSLSRWVDKRSMGHARSAAAAVELLRSQPGGNHIGVPFRFVDRRSIYDELDHATINAAIDAAPVRDIPIAQLCSIQHTVDRARVEAYIRNPKLARRGKKHSEHGGVVDLPIVVRWKGCCLVYDGNHRATAQTFYGGPTVQARYVDLDAIAKAKASRA